MFARPSVFSLRFRRWLLGSVRNPIDRSSVSDCPVSQQGLTLMECLVAVLLIGLTAAMVAPPLVLATATRVQNRRAEQALQVAQGEVDRVRVLVSRSDHTPARLPDVPAPAPTALSSVAAPTAVHSLIRSGANCTNRVTNAWERVAANAVLPVDVDGDCQVDYLMQVFRTQGITPADERGVNRQNRPSEFTVGVRVYSVLAATNYPQAQWPTAPTLRTDLGTEPASLQLTSGQGNQRTRPLAVIYSPISWSEDNATLCGLFGATERQQIRSCTGTF